VLPEIQHARKAVVHAPSRAHSCTCSCTQRRTNFRRHSWLHSVHMPSSFWTARMVCGPRPFRFSSHALRGSNARVLALAGRHDGVVTS
jgi:hypothetical protein